MTETLVDELRRVEQAGDLPPRGHPGLAKRAADRIEELEAALSSRAPQAGGEGCCLVTGNPVGTDTWQQGKPCQCFNCQAMLADAPKGDVRGALTALRNRLAMTSDEHWSAEDSRLARNVWLLSTPSQDEGEALRRALERLIGVAEAFYRRPESNAASWILERECARAREALSRSPEPICGWWDYSCLRKGPLDPEIDYGDED